MKKLLALFLLTAALAIGQTATSHTASVGKQITFSVTSDGTPPFTYQWYKAAVGAGTSSASAISGATGSSFIIPALSLSDAGTYYVRVSNSAGGAVSDNLVFTVSPLSPTRAQVTVTIK